MKLPPDQIARLERFFDRIKAETYPEPPMPLHTQLTANMLPQVLEHSKLTARPNRETINVLDVGCGQGVALELFRDAGMRAIGLTLNDQDLRACRDKGFDVREMEMSFLEFPDGSFDLVWCRHCLEHSIFPYFTLDGFNRVLTDDGWLYVEVPAPDTTSRHQTNPNHYSVLGRSMWQSLFTRTGFRLHAHSDVAFTTGLGHDEYWQFLLQKGGAGTLP